MKKNSGVSKIRAAGKILLTTTLAGTAATSAMTQSTTTSANFITDAAKRLKEWWNGDKKGKENPDLHGVCDKSIVDDNKCFFGTVMSATALLAVSNIILLFRVSNFPLVSF